MKLLGTVRSRLVFCGLATLAVVLLASGSAWMGYQAISAANENALRYANQATVLQTLIKDINQLITTEGRRRCAPAWPTTLQRLDAELSAGGEAGRVNRATSEKAPRPVGRPRRVAALLTEAKISVENDEVLVKVIKLVTRLDGLAEEVNALASKSPTTATPLARQTVLRVGGSSPWCWPWSPPCSFCSTAACSGSGGEPGYAARWLQRIADGELAAAIVRKVWRRQQPDRRNGTHAGKRANVDSLRQAAEENLRIRRALNNVSTGVLIADPNAASSTPIIRPAPCGALSPPGGPPPRLSADQLIGLPMEKLHADSQGGLPSLTACGRSIAKPWKWPGATST